MRTTKPIRALLAAAALVVWGCTDFELPTESALIVPGPAAFATVPEVGDAGDLVTGPAHDLTGQAVTQINGTISDTQTDADCYRITITNPAAFSVDVTTYMTPDSDSKLFLFDRIKQGIWSNDDKGDGSYLSRITAADFLAAGGEAGDHFLCMSNYGNNPESEKGYEIFHWTTGAPDPYRHITAGINSGSAIVHDWTRDGGGYGAASYTLVLTGVEGGPHPAPGHRTEENAGNLVSSPAQDLSNRLVTQIKGVLARTDTDADCFRISVANPSMFSAEVLALPPRHDSQLFLFRSDGSGLLANDDIVRGEEELSRIGSTGFASAGGAAGEYVLCISNYNHDPVNEEGERIFGSDGLPAPAAGSTSLVSWSWDTSLNLPVNRSPYTIVLTGVDSGGTTAPPPGFTFRGFFAPVKNPPEWNLRRAGLTVQMRWSLGGYQGMDILAQGSPASRPISCSTGAVLGEEQPAQPFGNHGLRYARRPDQYRFPWKTERSWRETCREFVLRLSDGSEHTARFRFR